MYMGGKLGVFDHRGHSWKLFPVILPILGATFVAITRVDDYWHHWTDVCTGAAIGGWSHTFSATFTITRCCFYFEAVVFMYMILTALSEDQWCHSVLAGLLSAYFCYRQHYPSLFDDTRKLFILSFFTLWLNMCSLSLCCCYDFIKSQDVIQGIRLVKESSLTISIAAGFYSEHSLQVRATKRFKSVFASICNPIFTTRKVKWLGARRVTDPYVGRRYQRLVARLFLLNPFPGEFSWGEFS